MPGGMPGMPGGLPGALGMGPRDLGPGAAVSLAQSLGLSRQEHLMSLAGSSAAAQAAMSAAMSSQASMTLGGPPSSHPAQPKMEAMSNVGLFSLFIHIICAHFKPCHYFSSFEFLPVVLFFVETLIFKRHFLLSFNQDKVLGELYFV